MKKIQIKTEEEIKIMAEGGKRLSEIKKDLRKQIKIGNNAQEIEDLATKLIYKHNGKPSFKMVSGYSWSTCINVNEGIVHGIPKKSVVFKDGDIVSVDIGIYFKNFHTDSAFSVLLGSDHKKSKFLEIGKRSLNSAIKKVKINNKIGDISQAIETELRDNNLVPIESLTGHGIGKSLHEAPHIPCFVSNTSDEKIIIREGMALAIEVMYTLDSPKTKLDDDKWTVRTKNGRMSALFEETVAITSHGRIVLTS